MPGLNPDQRSKCVITVALVCLCLAAIHTNAYPQADPNRPACTDAHCRKVEAFVRAHYCGQSPYGNGPDDGCQIKWPPKPHQDIDVVADFNCDWSETKKTTVCHQMGQPSPNLRTILVRELHLLGLPQRARGTISFRVLKSTHFGWSLAAADYSHLMGTTESVAEVIVLISPKSQVTVLRKVPFQKVDADVPAVTFWSAVDLVDADGNGQLDVILEGDAYENHWLVVVTLRNGSVVTIFSGLGYYL